MPLSPRAYTKLQGLFRDERVKLKTLAEEVAYLVLKPFLDGETGMILNDSALPSNVQRTDDKGQPNGYASLDGSGDVPDSQIPDSIARDAEVTAAIATHAGLTDPHSGYQLESEKGQPDGYAGLDGSGTVPDAQLPSSIARDAEVTAAIGTHEGAADPHAGYVLESLVDAKGDLLVGSAADALGRLAVGADGTVLTAASSEPLGVRWATVTATTGELLLDDAATPEVLTDDNGDYLYEG